MHPHPLSLIVIAGPQACGKSTLAGAFARAQADPTHGVSKELAFLREVDAAWALELEQMRPDLVLDTGSAPLHGCVARVEAALASARA